MEYYLAIIGVLIFMKVMFWSCYFYSRSQRAQRRLVVIDANVIAARRVQGPQYYNDQSAIICHDSVAQAAQEARSVPNITMSPPTYDEVTSCHEMEKPPPYSQATGVAPISNPTVQCG